MFVGEQQLATRTTFEGTEVGGLSGITYDPEKNLYYAISDDRAERGFARFYTLDLEIDAEGFHSVTIERMTEIKQPDGTSFARGSLDGEGIVFSPATGTLIWSSEGDSKGMPSISEMNVDGSFVRAFTLPDYYLPQGNERGIYNNLGFEAVQVSADGKSVIAATENALMQDGTKATLEHGSPVRMLVIDRSTGEVTAEYIYETGAIPNKATRGLDHDNGLADMLVLDDHTLLMLERSYASGVGNTINLYTADLTNTTNVAGVESIKDQAGIVPVAKTHVLTIHEGDFGLNIDNVEGLTFGAEIDDQRMLVMVSDNNFNAPQPYTQFIVFKVTIP
jgi:hypothetical protein